MKKTSQRNIILCVGGLYPLVTQSIRTYGKKHKTKFRIAVLLDQKDQKKKNNEKREYDDVDIILTCNTRSDSELDKTLGPYRKQIESVCVRGEVNIPLFRRIIPHIPYVKTPTIPSLEWSTDKILMRRRMTHYNKKITPRYDVAKDSSQKTIDRIAKKIGFPLIVKPSALAASKMISICYHKDELATTLRRIVRSVNAINKKGGDVNVKVLVEQFMEGTMYSIDSYVNSYGTVYHTPTVEIKTGKMIGFDDFFGYQQMTPSTLNKSSVEKAEETTKDAIHALGLRSTIVHTELMRMENSWKVIELSPRMGGFRHLMYEMSYGIDHTMNDIMIHASKKPIIPRRVKGYTVAMKFFAKQEGRLTKLTGIKKIQLLKSFKEVKVNKKIGDQCRYAKNNGSSVFNLILFNKERSKLLADIRRVEQMVVIQTKRK